MEAKGEAAYRLRFSRDGSRRAVVRGEVKARLLLRCERCLGEMAHEVKVTLSLAVVAGLDEADALPEGYEPLLVPEGRTRARDLIEDELLLGLPQIPRHASAQCAHHREAPPPEQRPEHPFAVLADWRARH